MCFVKTPDYNPPEIQEPAKIVDPQVQAKRDSTVAKARAAQGANSTILTGSGGVNTTQKTLLGQ